MARYTVEVLATARDGLETQVDRVREAVEVLAADGVRVRYLSSLYMPGDELCLHVLDGPSSEAVETAALHAGLDPIRVVETLTDPRFEPGAWA